MRLKEALRCLLPQTQPPPLRILPARFYGREAKFRYSVYKASKKSGTLQTSDIGHWFAIGTTFGAFIFFTNVKSQKLKKSLFRASAHTGVGTPKILEYFVERKAKRFDSYRLRFSSGFQLYCLVQTPLVLRPGEFLRRAALPTAPP